MILYHAITSYHLLKFAVHKLRYHYFDDAVLLIPSSMVHKPVQNSEEDSIFSKVIEFSWEKNNLSSKSIFEDIDHFLEHHLGKNYRQEITEYNIARAEYFFGSWAVENGIQFQWFEDGDGRFTQPEPIMKDDERINQIRFKLARENGLYTGNNINVTKKFIKFSSQIGEFSKEDIVDFDVVKELQQLSNDDRKKLLKFFDVPKDLTIQKNSCLMLTQHFSNIRILSYQEQALCYQLTIDYYMNRYHTYFKWHPSDFTPYPSFMENISMISGHFPSELFNLIVECKFKIGASINSTGILSLNSICEKILTFNQDYIKTFWYNHQYYFAAKLLEILTYKQACTIGINDIQLDNMCQFGLDTSLKLPLHTECLADAERLEECDIYIIGDLEECHSSILKFCEKHKNSIFVFLSFHKKSIFRLFIENTLFIVKEIKLFDITQNNLQLLDCLTIGILVPDKKIFGRIQSMKYVKLLLNTGVKTVVEEISDTDTQIAVLKGMLKATEEQLLQCTLKLNEYETKK